VIGGAAVWVVVEVVVVAVCGVANADVELVLDAAA
jgi:hypothetical protein